MPVRLAISCLVLAAAGSAQAVVVNIDATHGFTFDGGGSDPAPQPGQHINPIGAPVQLSLAAGDYLVTNAYARGLPGASFSAWSYNVGTSSWAWAYVLADAGTGKVIHYGEAGGASSAAGVAALPAVQSYSYTLSLKAPTTVLFTLRDYYVPDNAGGISLDVSPVPEPASAALLGVGGMLLAGLAARRRQR